MAELYRVIGGLSGTRVLLIALTAGADACAASQARLLFAPARGAHGFGPDKSPYFRGIFENANPYHLLHSAVLALAPALSPRPHLVGGLFTAGTALFCSSQYALGATEDRRSKMRRVGPPGATMLVAGWLALALP